MSSITIIVYLKFIVKSLNWQEVTQKLFSFKFSFIANVKLSIVTVLLRETIYSDCIIA